MAGIDPGGDPPKDASCALEYLICDAYSGYEAATETFEKCFGRPLTLQLCWVHAYRRLRDEIVRMGLYKAYITAIGDFDYRHFDDNLKAWFDARPKQTRPDSLIWRFLDLAMLVSNLSAMEESAKDDSPEEILEYRREEVAGVVDAIFSTAKNIAEDPRSHITYKYDREHDLFYSCRASDSAGWTGAICYLLNGEARLRTFLLDGSVSISNSLAERSLRPSAVHRNTSFIYKTMTGHQASAVLETLRMTCKLNGVSFPDYLCWLTTEVKFRCEERRLKSGITFQTFTAPPEPVEEITHDDGEKEKVRFSLFDDRYHCVTDDIPTEGLTPVDYLACRLRRANLDLPPEEDED